MVETTEYEVRYGYVHWNAEDDWECDHDYSETYSCLTDAESAYEKALSDGHYTWIEGEEICKDEEGEEINSEILDTLNYTMSYEEYEKNFN